MIRCSQDAHRYPKTESWSTGPILRKGSPWWWITPCCRQLSSGKHLVCECPAQAHEHCKFDIEFHSRWKQSARDGLQSTAVSTARQGTSSCSRCTSNRTGAGASSLQGHVCANAKRQLVGSTDETFAIPHCKHMLDWARNEPVALRAFRALWLISSGTMLGTKKKHSTHLVRPLPDIAM